MKQRPNVFSNKEGSKSLVFQNKNQILQQRKQHNELNLKQDFKKHASVVQGKNNTNTNVSILRSLATLTLKTNLR